MDNCKKQQLEGDFTRRNPVDDSGTDHYSTPSSLHKEPHPHGHGVGGGSSGRSPQLPVNEKNLVWLQACAMAHEYVTYGTLLGRPLPPQDSNSTESPDDELNPESDSLAHDPDESTQSVKQKNSVDWELAFSLSHEYVNHGTLLGIPWSPQDSNDTESCDKSTPESGSLDHDADID